MFTSGNSEVFLTIFKFTEMFFINRCVWLGFCLPLEYTQFKYKKVDLLITLFSVSKQDIYPKQMLDKYFTWVNIRIFILSQQTGW